MSISARMPTLIPRDSLLTRKNTGGLHVEFPDGFGTSDGLRQINLLFVDI
jgi:hypothetical protein